MVTHAAAGLALLCMNLSWPLTSLFGLLIVGSAWRAKRAQDHKHGVVLMPRIDGGLSLRRDPAACPARVPDGGADSIEQFRQIEQTEGIEAWVLPGVVLFPGVSWFTLAMTAADGRRLRLPLMLVKFEMDEADWRALRVWLRHCALKPSNPVGK
jgi:hypothetical protein